MRLIPLLSALFLFYSCGANSPRETTSQALAVSASSTELSTTPKPTVNVYLENSGSMFGYIRTGNDFDRSISSLLTSIRVSDYSDSINLFYISSKTYKQSVDIPTFIKSINIHNAQTWPGDLGRTDMCALFKTVTEAVNDNAISIFISDCIFSPGQGVSAKQYIGAEKDCITLAINDLIKQKDLAFVVYRLLSGFNGNYFDCQDNRTQINDQRPYFIWIIGTRAQIAAFRQKIPPSKIEGELENSYTLFKSANNVSYALQIAPKIGSFDRVSPTSIRKAKKDRDNGKFMFSVAVDFSELLVDDSYLTDPINYKISNPNYDIVVVKNRIGDYTHLIKVTSTAGIISPTNLLIQLKNIMPTWIDEFSDDTCENIHNDGMMRKSYGFKQIVEGIYNAYNYENNVLSELTIRIN